MDAQLPSRTQLDPAAPRRIGALWIPLLMGPVTFLLDLEVSYMLLGWRCDALGRPALLALKLLPILFTGASAVPAWRAWHRDAAAESHALVQDRTRFLALMGMLSCVFFVLVQLANALPVLLLSPCDR